MTVQAAGRGNPKINLSDGHELLTSYVGPQELSNALQQNLAEPLSLASADFDEDGVPDLVSGYAYDGRGIITLHRGNVDSIYPNAPEAKQRKADGTFTAAPFLSPGRVFDARVAADFLAAGDFDADGHFDLAAAGRGNGVLLFFAGDGHGGFAEAREISLPGTVTALTTGEVNRADGLTDVVVGVTNELGSTVLVFEGPNGSLKAQPEILTMPGTVTALAVGQLDQDELGSGADGQLRQRIPWPRFAGGTGEVIQNNFT
ncbi:MAG TPA: VCBS repeat-containing protein [Pyrinomonadaceae bacterium]